ncbi:hypothetical protein GDO81_004808 [Engystomops pustulosus]|uniref:Uncharacterized protein n=1 Tax=Engystomops pustulosus TaxID=76066 RepID=A0AAV7CJA2_ENGPU|nr:hypothetical protein GDO81_004808 [Engystomops pustulosus]
MSVCSCPTCRVKCVARGHNFVCRESRLYMSGVHSNFWKVVSLRLIVPGAKPPPYIHLHKQMLFHTRLYVVLLFSSFYQTKIVNFPPLPKLC